MIKYNLYVGNEKMNFSLIGLDDFFALQEIDSFTSRFKSEEEVKDFLVKAKMFNGNKNNKLFIEYSYKYLRKLDPVFEKHKKFIMPIDLEGSYYKIYDTMVNYFEDKDFLKKLYTFCKSHANSNAYLVKNLIAGVELEYGEKSQIVSDICESLMVKYKDGERSYNYKSIRDLGMFMFNYYQLQKATNSELDEEKPLFIPYEGEQMSFLKK